MSGHSRDTANTSQSYTFANRYKPPRRPKFAKEYACSTAPPTDKQTTEKNNEGITAATRNWRFRVTTQEI